ncbi:tripartite tricarboxylate transporter substrate binding protein [Rubrivivax sp. RP6-9]|uniref:tripartite tricarboxylate transporter substrate binding protein n=1 Tax=Rubrivivax sp. RP6-9 TaxID=3415750 RepID=UPI003CC62433
MCDTRPTDSAPSRRQVLSLLLAAAPAALRAERPLRLTVPYPAGGIVDATARALAAPLARALGEELVVENIPGAAGALGLQQLLASGAEGQVLALGTDSDTILAPLVNPDVRLSPQQFRSLGRITSAPLALLAGPALAGSLATRLAEGRAGRALQLASYGVGSNAHLCAEDFAQRCGVALVHVPYKGVAPLLQDLIGGHVESAFLPLFAGVADSVQAGKLRALGVASAERVPRFASVPPLAEAASLSDFVHVSWSALMASAAIPEPRAVRLNQALRQVLSDAGVLAALAAAGGTVESPRGPAEARAQHEQQTAATRRLLAQLAARGVSLVR